MTEVTRRDLLKAVVPGAWALDLRKGGGLGGLPPASQIGLVKDVLIFTGGLASVVIKEKSPPSFKETVLSLDWKKAQGKELEVFTGVAADEYLRLTKTTRVTKADLLRTHFVKDRVEFINAAKGVGKGFTLTERTWGMTDYPKREVYIDPAKVREIFFPITPKEYDPNKTAGRAFLHALWHEWGRLDITERKLGQLIDNPQYFFIVPETGQREVFRMYIGGAVFTDTYFGYTRFESVWNNSIAFRRMSEQVGLDWVFGAGEYEQNGIGFFPEFTRAVGISLDSMYTMHATSDFEGFVELLGQKLPGNLTPLQKGTVLINGIHRNDSNMVAQSGALQLIPKK